MATRLFRETPGTEAVPEVPGLDSLNAAMRSIVLPPEEALKTHQQHSPLRALL